LQIHIFHADLDRRPRGAREGERHEADQGAMAQPAVGVLRSATRRYSGLNQLYGDPPRPAHLLFFYKPTRGRRLVPESTRVAAVTIEVEG
jgi:hypothetical protein